jgi:hypothetical protein
MTTPGGGWGNGQGGPPGWGPPGQPPQGFGPQQAQPQGWGAQQAQPQGWGAQQPQPQGFGPQQPPQGWGAPQGQPPQGAMVAQAAPVRHAGSSCDLCGRHAPTKSVTFMQNVGVIVMRFPKTVRGDLCKRCISSCFWRMTTITFFFGWWGVISFFHSLIAIPANIVAYLGASGLADE